MLQEEGYSKYFYCTMKFCSNAYIPRAYITINSSRFLYNNIVFLATVCEECSTKQSVDVDSPNYRRIPLYSPMFNNWYRRYNDLYCATHFFLMDLSSWAGGYRY